MIGERARQPGESDESWTAHCSLVATLSLRAILATSEGREALKALLTEDGPQAAAAKVVGNRERLSPTGIRARDTADLVVQAAVDGIAGEEQ